MSLKDSPGVNLKPEFEAKTSSNLQKQSSRKSGSNGIRTKCTGTCKFRLPKRPELLPMRYVQHIGRKVSLLMRFISSRGRGTTKKEGVSSSSGRAKPFVTPIDSHRAEAIDDCIEFINSSSSLQKSNSVTR